MRKLISFLTTSYAERSHFTKRKAEYSAVFMLLILLVMIAILSVEFVSFGFSRVKLEITMGFIFGFMVLFILLKLGFLEASLNLLLLSGFLRCVTVIDFSPGIQFYSLVSLILLTIAVVHIKHYQLYLSYIFSLLLAGFRIIISPPASLGKFSSFHQGIYSFFLLIVYLVMIHFVVKVIEQEIRESAKLARLAETDTLTGAGNRRKLHTTLESFSGVTGSVGYSLLLLDLDHFKRINDEFGHDRGDLVLQDIVNVVKGEIREEDSLYRWGGEEFLILIPSSDSEKLLRAAERIRSAVEAFDFSGNLKVTVSIGAVAGKAGDELNSLIRQADEALYRAKVSGRNRVCG